MKKFTVLFRNLLLSFILSFGFTSMVLAAAPAKAIQKVPIHNNNLEITATPDGTITGVKRLPYDNPASLISLPQTLSRYPWPLTMPGVEISGDMVVADVNNDGRKETIVVTVSGSSNTLWIFDDRGNLLPGWPQSRSVAYSHGNNPVVGDIDQDGDMEIFMWAHGFHHTGLPVAGWPKIPPGCSGGFNYIQVSAIADVDNNGTPEVIGFDPEIFVTTNPCFVGSQVFIWNGQGQLLPGMPVSLPVVYNSGGQPLTHGIRNPPSVGDIDGDGDLEIVFAAILTNLNFGNHGDLYAYHHTGQTVNGWPQPLVRAPASGVYYWNWSPTFADIDRNGTDEIVVVYAEDDLNVFTYKGFINVFRGNGTTVPGWPQTITTTHQLATVLPAASVGELDGDPGLEIVITQDNVNLNPVFSALTMIYAFNAENGTPVTGWPQSVTNFYINPVMGWSINTVNVRWPQATITNLIPKPRPCGGGTAMCAPVLPAFSKVSTILNDGWNNITRIFTWDGDGRPMPSLTFDINNSNTAASLAVGDFDNDNDLDVAAPGTLMFQGNIPLHTSINFFDLNSMNVTRHDWSMFGHDINRTYRHR